MILDADWDGSPGAAAIERDLEARVAAVWDPEDVVVIVPDPEIEALVLVARQSTRGRLRATAASGPTRCPAQAGHWADDHAKPPRPKEALEYLHRVHGTDLSPAVRRRAAEKVSVRGCQDPAFHRLRTTLQRWFPAEGR